MYDDDLRPHPKPAARRDIDEAKSEILREVWDAKASIQTEIEKHSEITRNQVRFYSGGFFYVFIPAFLAVVAGGYVVKYWL